MGDLLSVQGENTSPEINVSAAAGGTTFDDFEQLESAQREQKSIDDAKEAKAKENHKKIEEKTKEQVDNKMPEQLKKEKENEEVQQPKDEESVSNEESNDETKQESEAKPKKIIKLGETEVDANSMVPVKIDGKITEVPLQELINSHSGKVAIDKRFSELDKKTKEFTGREKQFKQEYDLVTGHLKEVAGKFKSALNDKNVNPLDAVEYMLDIIGENGNNYYNRVLEHLWPTFEHLYNASDESREAFFVKKENEYLKRSSERRQSLESSAQSKKQQAQELDNQRQKIGISEEEFVNLHDELAKRSNGEQVKPEQVLQAATRMKAMEKARRVVSRVDQSKLEDIDAMYEIADGILEDPSISDGDLVEILRDHWKVATPEEKAVNEKLQKLPPKKTSTPKVKGNFKKGFESFDDYEK